MHCEPRQTYLKLSLDEVVHNTIQEIRRESMEFFLNGADLSLSSVNLANSRNLTSRQNMNWAQFSDSVTHVCLAGVVVASWSLTQEVAGSSPFTVV